MKKTILLFLPIITLTFPQLAFAEVSVNISNKSNVSQQSSSTTKTDVTIDTNGTVKTFHSEGNETINWTSDDGKSHVNINSQGSNNNSNVKGTSTVNTTIHTEVNSSGSKVEVGNTSPSATVNENTNNIEQKKMDLFTLFRRELDFLNNLASSFFKKMFR